MTVENHRSFNGNEGRLPLEAPAMIGIVPGVRAETPTADLTGGVYRTDLVPPYLGSGVNLRATELSLLGTIQGQLSTGSFLKAANARYPAAVLGHNAAQALGIARLDSPVRIFAAGRWFSVVGILAPLELAPEIDSSVLIGVPYAESELGYDGHSTRIYVRADPDRATAVSTLLARTASPENPDQVQINRPSDALAARLAVSNSGIALFVGLGALALLVGGVGVANVMVIAVLERRSEIGLRRALGATRAQVGVQFLIEALLLAFLGGAAGIALGTLVTVGYAFSAGTVPLIPAIAAWGGMAVALLIGAVAGLYPALRAARLSPTEALRTV
ncbi:MAG: ABC transporter permease [Candidatus Dormibacteraeota bacterium]|nr:ABC transporter permease [Candidatus Dormibacteraeota bacterium]